MIFLLSSNFNEIQLQFNQILKNAFFKKHTSLVELTWGAEDANVICFTMHSEC